jgi:hypothetical protein
MNGRGSMDYHDRPQRPFTVVLSVGAPRPDTRSAAPRREAPPNDDDRVVGGRSWLWQQSVSALLHAVFLRGGTVASRMNDELLPFAWGVAQTHAAVVAAERGAFARTPSIYLLRDGAGQRRPDADDPTTSFAAFEATGLVGVRHRPVFEGDLPGPPPHFGMVLWPDASTQADQRLLSHTERATVLRWPGDTVEGLPRRAVDLIIEDANPPLHWLLERTVDSWLEGEWDLPQWREP